MKKLLFLGALAALILGACKTEKSKENVKTETVEVKYASFGDEISKENALTKEQMNDKFQALKAGDTVNVKFASKINSVCKKKGCWMKLDLGSEKESMVRFKDYGFFMPLNADDKEVIVEGKAYLKTTTVAELQHYAKDAGKSEEEIAEITEPKHTYAFEAVGVLMKE